MLTEDIIPPVAAPAPAMAPSTAVQTGANQELMVVVVVVGGVVCSNVWQVI